MAMRGPQLELGIAGRAQPRQVIGPARIQVDAGDGLRVTPVEPLGQSDHRRECPDDAAVLRSEVGEALV